MTPQRFKEIKAALDNCPFPNVKPMIDELLAYAQELTQENACLRARVIELKTRDKPKDDL